jgi:hypothetical protein
VTGEITDLRHQQELRADPPLEIFTGKPLALAGIIRPTSMPAVRGRRQPFPLCL